MPFTNIYCYMMDDLSFFCYAYVCLLLRAVETLIMHLTSELKQSLY